MVEHISKVIRRTLRTEYGSGVELKREMNDWVRDISERSIESIKPVSLLLFSSLPYIPFGFETASFNLWKSYALQDIVMDEAIAIYSTALHGIIQYSSAVQYSRCAEHAGWMPGRPPYRALTSMSTRSPLAAAAACHPSTVKGSGVVASSALHCTAD